MIFDHVVDSSWTWVKNPDYWGYDEKFPQNKLPYVDKVRQLVIPDYTTQMAALRSGKIDSLGADITNAANLRKSNPELVERRYFGSAGAYPMDATKVPLNDVRVRKAMQMAINLKEISDTYYEGQADPTPFGQLGEACIGYYLPYAQWEEEWKEGYTYNPVKAKQLMTEAGYPNGFKIQFNRFPSWSNADVLQIVQDYWKVLGIELDVKVFDTAAYVGKVFAKSGGPIGSWYVATNYEPMAWIKVQYYSKNPWSFPVGDPAYDALVEKADAAATEQEQMKLIQECEAYAIPKHWSIVLPRAPSFGFSQPWFKGSNGEGGLGGGLLSATQARFWIDRDLKYKMTGLRD
jgi:peptide/nickel transport system substrate-binding protein